MRLEVTVDNEDPKVYPLDRPKIVIGSHPSCDIVIQSSSVSRKHLVVISQDDQFYVSDQGSTNGSFLNEERLVPGMRSEFSSFFPVRLGTTVLLSLISDEESPHVEISSLNNFTPAPKEEEVERPDSTRMISLKDLNKGSTTTLVKKRNQTVEKKKTQAKGKQSKKKNDNSLMLKGLFFLAIFAGAAYYNLRIAKNKHKVVDDKAGMEQVKQVVTAKPVFSGPIQRIDETQLPLAENILGLRDNPKCRQENEKYLCATLPNIYQGKYGVVTQDKMLIVYADGLKYRSLAREYVKSNEMADLQLVMISLWVRDNFPKDLTSFNGLKDQNITVAFVDLEKEAGEMLTAAVFVPESLFRLSTVMDEKHFEVARTEGHLAFSYVLDYLRFL